MRSSDKERYMSKALRHLIEMFRPEDSQKHDIVQNELMLLSSKDKYQIMFKKHKENNYKALSSFIYSPFDYDLYIKAIRWADEDLDDEIPSANLYNYFIRDHLLKEHVYKALNDLEDIKTINITLDKCKVPKLFVAL